MNSTKNQLDRVITKFIILLPLVVMSGEKPHAQLDELEKVLEELHMHLRGEGTEHQPD